MVKYSMQTAAAGGIPSAPLKRMRVGSSIGGDAAAAAAATLPSAPPAPSPLASIASASDSTGTSTPFLATFDVDTLDCTLCMESLRPPVFQCPNGHIACKNCHEKLEHLEKRCPSCSCAMGKIRCLALEKLIETLKVTCKYADFGCGSMPRFLQKANHELGCTFKPCECPVQPCVVTMASKDLPDHLEESHGMVTKECSPEVMCSLNLDATETHVLLRVDGIYFLLVHEKEDFGSKMHLLSFVQREFSYELEVKNERKTCVFEGDPQSLVDAQAAPDFFLVPSHMYSDDEPLRLNIRFRYGNSASGPAASGSKRKMNSM